MPKKPWSKIVHNSVIASYFSQRKSRMSHDTDLHRYGGGVTEIFTWSKPSSNIGIGIYLKTIQKLNFASSSVKLHYRAFYWKSFLYIYSVRQIVFRCVSTFFLCLSTNHSENLFEVITNCFDVEKISGLTTKFLIGLSFCLLISLILAF